MWIMNDLWPIETLCIIIIVDYAKSKINEAFAMYVPRGGRTRFPNYVDVM